MKPSKLITKLVDQGPIAFVSDESGAVRVTPDMRLRDDPRGQSHWRGVRMSFRQAAAVARAVQDAEPHQN